MKLFFVADDAGGGVNPGRISAASSARAMSIKRISNQSGPTILEAERQSITREARGHGETGQTGEVAENAEAAVLDVGDALALDLDRAAGRAVGERTASRIKWIFRRQAPLTPRPMSSGTCS